MLELLNHLWKHFVVTGAALIIISNVLKGIRNINLFGKRIYTSVPALWKWFFRSAAFRKKVNESLQLLQKQCTTINTNIESINLRMDIYDRKIHLMYFRMDTEGAITFISDTFLKLFDLTEDEILGYAYENMIHQEDTVRVRDKWKRCCEKCSRFFDEHRMINKRGEFILCTVTGIPMREMERCSGFYGTIEVINEENHHHAQDKIIQQ